MPIADIGQIFPLDKYNQSTLTAAINNLPYVPQRIGQMGLFDDKPIATTAIQLEIRDGVIQLIQTSLRGSPANKARTEKRKMISFVVPHLQEEDAILTADLQNLRDFGSASTFATLDALVNDKLAAMRASHEVTIEHLCLGALKGKVLDADGTTLFDLFSSFGIAENTQVDFVLGTSTTSMVEKCDEVKTVIEKGLGNDPYQRIHAFCGAKWFRRFVSHADVTAYYKNTQDIGQLRSDLRTGFTFQDITFEVYRGTVGGKPFIGANEVRFFPVGTPGLFKLHLAPADFTEELGNLGRRFYAKRENQKYNRGLDLYTQSNPLPLCLKPGALLAGTSSN